MNGVVDTKNQFGIFINVGCEACHGKLQLPRFMGNQLIRGQVLRDLCVATVDLENRRVRLIMDDVDGAIADPEMVSLATLMADADRDTKDPKADAPKQKKADREPKPKAKDRPELKEPARVPKAKSQPKVEEVAEPEPKEEKEVKEEEPEEMQLEPGDLVDGVVTTINAKGVWVNIGGGKKGLLEVPAELKGEFRRGDSVQGMRVEEVKEDGHPVLSMDDPELEVEEPSRRTRNKPKGKAKGKSNQSTR